MRWSFKIARIAGIEVRVHVTFFLLLAFGAWYGSHAGPGGAVSAVILWLLLFLCVLLHEFGHALAAKAYGIKTADITMMPMGGVARLERMPEKPIEELVVVIAGPLVNLAIALLLGAVLLFTGGRLGSQIFAETPQIPNLLAWLFAANIAMFLFNLIPAFPLDGGRILRALLATQMDYAKATQVAASIGQGLALVLGLIGLFNPGYVMLILIAVFIYMGAESESSFVQMRHATIGLPVSSAMVTRFATLNQGATLDQAIDALLGSSQHEFPVLDDNGGFAGLLTKHDLLVALRKAGPELPVKEVMVTGLPTLLPQMSMDHAFSTIREAGVSALPVVDNSGTVVGLFTTENLGELIMVQNALGKNTHRYRA
jgi:Zn-dependent protease/CBS domain-containing protein